MARSSFFTIVFLTSAFLSTCRGSTSDDISLPNFDRIQGHHFHHRRHPTNRQHTRQAEGQQHTSDQNGDMGSEALVTAPRSYTAVKHHCPSCLDREFFVNFTKQELKTEILRKLGMRSAPEVSAADLVPKHIVKQLLNQHQDQLRDPNDVMSDEPRSDYHIRSNSLDGDELLDDDDYHFQTKQITILAQNSENIIPEKLNQKWEIQYFSLQSSHFQGGLWRGVVRAKLFVNLPEAPSADDTEAWINVYYVSMDKHGTPFLTQAKASRFRLRTSGPGWANIEVTDIVSLWFKNQTDNFGLVLNVSTGSGKKIDVGVQHQTSNVPYMVLEIKENSSSNRRKRTLGKVCSEETDAAETHCCMWPLFVDFEKEFGWTFIIHPTTYEANFCSGDCSLGVVMPSTVYTHMIQQSNVSPCCTPQKMSGINMLYIDENKNVVLGKLPKMKVERCGCA